MIITFPNDHSISLPIIVFHYLPVHCTTELLRQASKTSNKTTTANQYLEQPNLLSARVQTIFSYGLTNSATIYLLPTLSIHKN